MEVLENRWRGSVGDDGQHVQEGTTIKDGRARSSMAVAAIVVKGRVQNVHVRLGEEALTPGAGVTPLEPARKITKGEKVEITFAGGPGSVELAGRRARKYEQL